MTIKYLHVRFINGKGVIQPNGGLSVAYTYTETDIILAVAMCHDNDLFCYRVGRLIAAGRLTSKKIEAKIIELKHPITHTIIDWLSLEYLECPVLIFLDEKHRWVSTFEPDESENIVSNTNWLDQIVPQTEGDQGLRI